MRRRRRYELFELVAKCHPRCHRHAERETDNKAEFRANGRAERNAYRGGDGDAEHGAYGRAEHHPHSRADGRAGPDAGFDIRTGRRRCHDPVRFDPDPGFMRRRERFARCAFFHPDVGVRRPRCENGAALS